MGRLPQFAGRVKKLRYRKCNPSAGGGKLRGTRLAITNIRAASACTDKVLNELIL
jgi:hypothetical protein